MAAAYSTRNFHALIRQKYGGNSDLFRNLVREFLNETKNIYPILSDAFLSKDGQELHIWIQRIRKFAVQFDDSELLKWVASLEEKSASRDTGALPVSLKQVSESLDRLGEDLINFLNQGQNNSGTLPG